jgi:hypothetical protein
MLNPVVKSIASLTVKIRSMVNTIPTKSEPVIWFLSVFELYLPSYHRSACAECVKVVGAISDLLMFGLLMEYWDGKEEL